MRFPCIVLMPRDSSQTWASRVNVTAPRNSRFSQYPSPKQSFLIEVFEQRIWNSYNFFCFDGSKKKRLNVNRYFILLLVESLHTRFSFYLNTFLPLSNFERVSRKLPPWRTKLLFVNPAVNSLRRQSRQRPTRRDRNNAWWPPKENNTRASCVIGRNPVHASNSLPKTISRIVFSLIVDRCRRE